jgi:flagellin-like hook-associated protein FlgL
VTGSLGGENFGGDLAAFQRGHSDTITLTGSRNNTITLTYYQSATAGTLSDEAIDFTGSSMTFVAQPGTATVSGLSVTSGMPPGTYAFTSPGPGALLLAGNGCGVGDMAPNTTQTLTLGNVSFTLTADANGMSAAAILASLLQPQNDNVVITSSGNPATPGKKVITGAATGAAAATFQVGANSGDTLSVAFGDARAATLLSGTAVANFSTAANGATWENTDATYGTTGAAVSSALIAQVDTALDALNNTDANLGAVENRLTHTIAAVGVASSNLNASQSRIRDLNVAAEMLNFTKTQILQQAGTAILAQANSAPQNVLALLR